ncbi:Flp pilus assembly protein TadD, contains TPR repeats [Anaerobiospirillum thomasii]|uniref:Flp pilus assembly protein TadD, contains TPR repeats n=1 Tax=Anaerobiospirillum thomasii TaxID=179995 RepID=A0A2X0V9D1_9GAMM|nr:tetratricopeptide repeat protein [Anaerobiospirillum thomasii]SPT69405.1 Flp pilus assembly protein TadD, contains TPR repeats [Anaerobiospirillum thomasii]SPT72028.1 Flp pilus assembly protein TadD, contains TPR repeats [Anaerobiospirillum thomasii]
MQLTEHNIKNIVFEESMHKAVFVYFYQDVPECAATTQALTSQIGENNAYVSLVMANIETQISQALAMQLGLRGVPAVLIFKNGQPVDAMQGDKIADDLPAILQKYMPSEAELLMRQALEAQEQDRLSDAITLCAKAYELDDSLEIKHTLAHMYIRAKNLDMAQKLLDTAGREEKESQEYMDLVSALTLAQKAQSSPAILELEDKHKANPDDIATLTALAIAYKDAGKLKAALELLYEYLKKDLSQAEVKQTFLDILSTISGDPLQNEYRRKLYTLMY